MPAFQIKKRNSAQLRVVARVNVRLILHCITMQRKTKNSRGMVKLSRCKFVTTATDLGFVQKAIICHFLTILRRLKAI